MGYMIGFIIGVFLLLFLIFGWPVLVLPIMAIMDIRERSRIKQKQWQDEQIRKEEEKQRAIEKAQEEAQEEERKWRERLYHEKMKIMDTPDLASDKEWHNHRSFSREEIEKFVSYKILYIKPREDLTQVSEDDFQTVL